MRTILAGIFFSFLLSGSHPLPGKDRRKEDIKKLASVDGTAITEAQVREDGADDLDRLALQKLKSEAVFARNEREIMVKSLNRLVEKKLLKEEAARRGITEKQLIASELDTGLKEPTDEEIEAFYKENIQRIKRPKEEVLPQIREYLKRQEEARRRDAFLAKLEKEHHVSRFLEPLRFNVDAPDRPVLGPDSAPVTLVLFSDFQCPYCKSFSSTLKQVLTKYGDKVRLVFRQFPLISIHPHAQKAAEAALCAADQQHFWEMHDLLFQNQSNLDDQSLEKMAEKLGLDVPAFDKCLSADRPAALVHEDVVAGNRAGAEGTPSIFINGLYMNGNIPLEELSGTIDAELAKRK